MAGTKSTSTSYSHTGLTAGSTRHYRVSPINSEGAGTASGADSATTRLQPNSAPTAVGTIPDQVIIPGTELALNMSSYFNDPDDDALTYRISSTDPFSKQSVSGSIVKLLLSASDYICDPETVNVTARDPGGLEATQKITLRRVNDPPVASTNTFPSLTIEVGESIRPYVANWFSDTDSCDEGLTYTAESSDTRILTASGSGNGFARKMFLSLIFRAGWFLLDISRPLGWCRLLAHQFIPALLSGLFCPLFRLLGRSGLPRSPGCPAGIPRPCIPGCPG